MTTDSALEAHQRRVLEWKNECKQDNAQPVRELLRGERDPTVEGSLEEPAKRLRGIPAAAASVQCPAGLSPCGEFTATVTGICLDCNGLYWCSAAFCSQPPLITSIYIGDIFLVLHVLGPGPCHGPGPGTL